MSIANSLELGMLTLINGARITAGLEPLRLITLLNEAAEAHSNWMVEADMFSHDGEDGTSPADRMAAAGYPFEGSSLALENIGWQSARGDAGYEDDVAQIHESLMSSPGHRANILNPDANHIGIGIETGTFTGQNGDYEAVMITQVFGATDADISAWVDPGTVEGGDVPAEDIIVEDPAGDDTSEDTVDDPVMQEEPADDEVVAEKDGADEAPDDPQPVGDRTQDEPAGDDPDGEDVAMEDEPGQDGGPSDGDLADDTPEFEMPSPPQVPLPCGLAQFTLDLTGAFAFRQEGDQLIWETSEDKLVETFLAAFEDWAGVPDEAAGDVIDVMAEDGDTSLADLLSEDMPRLPVAPQPAEEDEADDWDLVTCA